MTYSTFMGTGHSCGRVVTYRRSPGPPHPTLRLGTRRLAPAPTLSGGYPCRLALTPGWSARGADLRAGGYPASGWVRLAGYPSPGWVWRGVSGRPGGPGLVRPKYTSSNLRPHVLSAVSGVMARRSRTISLMRGAGTLSSRARACALISSGTRNSSSWGKNISHDVKRQSNNASPR